MTHRFPALIAAPAAAQGRLWLTGARLFDGTGAPLREHAAVLVEDGVIRLVTDAGQPCPDGARALDITGRVLMPGLTDAHTHASGSVPSVDKGAEEPLPGVTAHFLQAELRDYLRLGVTTIRVTGSQGLMPQEARQAMRYGAFRGPRLLTCGKIISATAPGGRFYGDMYREADGEDDVRRAVREQIRSGRRLRQDDDHRRPLQRAGRSGPAPAHRPGDGRRHRRGAPAGLPRLRPRRGRGRLRGRDQARSGHHRARHVPARAAGPAGAMAAAARCWCPRCPATTGCQAWARSSTRRGAMPSLICRRSWRNWPSGT